MHIESASDWEARGPLGGDLRMLTDNFSHKALDNFVSFNPSSECQGALRCPEDKFGDRRKTMSERTS